MEIELKYNIPDKETAEKIWENELYGAYEEPDSREEIFMDAYYYDTEDFSLSDNDMAYRVRKEGEGWVAALKWKGCAEGALHKREELSIPVDGSEPDTSVFCQNESGRHLESIVAGRELICMIRSSIARKRFRIDTGNGIYEFSIDRGKVVTPLGEEPVLEVEVELFSGDTEELQTIGENLKEQFGLEDSEESKYGRGLRLLGREDA